MGKHRDDLTAEYARSRYFVYVLFDDRGLPLYVGSSRYRYRLHRHNKHIEFRQNKRIGVILREDLEEETAMQIEAELIAAIGVRPFGPLVNKANYRNFCWRHTEGHKQRVGEWSRSRVVSAHTRELLSQARIGKRLTPEQREARKGRSSPNKGKPSPLRGKKLGPRTPEQLARYKAAAQDPIRRERIRQAALKRPRNKYGSFTGGNK